MGVQLDNKHRYVHVPKSVETSRGSNVAIFWNQEMRADRTVPNNKPDSVMRDKGKGNIGVAVRGDRNVIKKEDEKILKYKDLTTEIQRMCNVTAKVIPVVIIGATGTISKSVQTVPEQRTGKGGNEGTADNSHIGHCTQTAGSADVKVQNILQGPNNITCSSDWQYRTAATLYIP